MKHIMNDESYEGLNIEAKIRKAMDGSENLEMGKPAVFGERSKGVIPSTDIRTDKWLVAMEAQEHVNQMKTAEYNKITEQKEQQKPSAEAE